MCTALLCLPAVSSWVEQGHPTSWHISFGGALWVSPPSLWGRSIFLQVGAAGVAGASGILVCMCWFPAWHCSLVQWECDGHPKNTGALYSSPQALPCIGPWLCWAIQEWVPTFPGTARAKPVWETLPGISVCREPRMDVTQCKESGGLHVPHIPFCVPLWGGSWGRAGAEHFQPKAE